MKLTQWGGASAELSQDGVYRYRLDRWVISKGRRSPMLAFMMLNPSTADALKDDQTVRRCRGFAEAFGYSWFAVVNLYAYRATDPAALAAVARQSEARAIGPHNAAHVIAAARGADEIVLAWGGKVPCQGRADDVVAMLRREGLGGRLRVLGRTAGGAPHHPLFMPSHSKLKGIGP